MVEPVQVPDLPEDRDGAEDTDAAAVPVMAPRRTFRMPADKGVTLKRETHRVVPEGKQGCRPWLALAPGRAIYVGPLLDNTLHSHHAIQVSIGLEGNLRVWTSSPERRDRQDRRIA